MTVPVTNDRPTWNPRIINMSICTPPQALKDGGDLLATFGAILSPIRADNLRLVRVKGELRLWTSSRDLRIDGPARRAIIEAALQTAREALDGMSDIAGGD